MAFHRDLLLTRAWRKHRKASIWKGAWKLSKMQSQTLPWPVQIVKERKTKYKLLLIFLYYLCLWRGNHFGNIIICSSCEQLFLIFAIFMLSCPPVEIPSFIPSPAWQLLFSPVFPQKRALPHSTPAPHLWTSSIYAASFKRWGVPETHIALKSYKVT